jgi:site-specific recombinase
MNFKPSVRDVLEGIASYSGHEVHLLSRLIGAIRPSRKERKAGKVHGFEELLLWVRSNERYRKGLSDYLNRLLRGKKISSNLSDANMITGTDFWRELRDRVSYKVLPYQPPRSSIESVLVNVFYRESDGKWIDLLDEQECGELLDLLGFKGMYERTIDDFLIQELLFAARVLSHRVTGHAFEKEVLRMVPEYANFQSPFIGLQDEIDLFMAGIRKGEFGRDQSDQEMKQLKMLIRQCQEFIDKAYRNREHFGISFKVHQQLMGMERMLERLILVLDFITITQGVESREKLIRFIKTLVNINVGKTMVMGYLNKATQLMAREITQHIGKKGEHYITNSSTEFWKMFRTALGGGFIVAFACIIKLQLGKVDISLFGKAFLYSMNYAAAFIGIYLLHFTLATKQPAMTAARLAQVIEEDVKGKKGFATMAALVAKLFRSQFIAFLGNVLMAFPVALGFVYLWDLAFEVNLPEKKADTLIRELHPWVSPAVFHAAIAGVFLFVSGLIAGNVSNRTLYRRVAERIKEHPALRFALTDRMRERLAGYYERNMGGIISNLWFGVFMGSTGTVGIILGLNLDIRHITFAAGNLGLGLYGMGFDISWRYLTVAIVGVGVIGFVNFIVSFTLSLMLALRSRGVPVSALFGILWAVRKEFFKSPMAFFFPPRVESDTAKALDKGNVEKEK